MIIRKMTGDEYKQAKIIGAVAFEFPFDYEKLMAEIENPDKPSVVNGIEEERICAFSDDEKTMYGSIGVIPYNVQFDGHEVMMGGIGGVATLPTYRRNGAIRESFVYMLNDLKEKNVPLSYLYPFSCSYYRKFGYEINSTVDSWTIDFKALKKFGVGGSTEFLMPEEGHERLSKIYHKMYEGYNLSGLRNENDFGYFTKRDTFNNKRYAYIWKNEEGEEKAYIMFKKENENGKNIMDCTHHFMSKNDIAFVDAEGFCGLMDFALTFASNYDAIKFEVPSSLKITGLIEEQNAAKAAACHRGMVRVVDVEQILKLAKYKGCGEVKIKIIDKHCDWNTAIFDVKFVDNKAVSVEKTDVSPDVAMDISTFSALITGVYNSINDCIKLDLQILNKDADLDKIFYSKKNVVIDLF